MTETAPQDKEARLLAANWSIMENPTAKNWFAVVDQYGFRCAWMPSRIEAINEAYKHLLKFEGIEIVEKWLKDYDETVTIYYQKPEPKQQEPDITGGYCASYFSRRTGYLDAFGETAAAAVLNWRGKYGRLYAPKNRA